MIGIHSSNILKLPFVAEYLGATVKRYVRCKVGIWSATAGWGRRPSGLAAVNGARANALPCLLLEDGFLRSFGTGRGSPPLSLVVDRCGIYYDSTAPSDLENYLNTVPQFGLVDAADVMRAKQAILHFQLSKYNAAPAWDASLLRTEDVCRVLVIDQTVGDQSVAFGGACAETFAQMLAAARAENPHATVYIKTHPEVSAGKKQGYLTHIQDSWEAGARTVMVRQPVAPQSLFVHMDRVYTVTSTMGFEALLAGKPVSVFGLPWYAGWGVTDDRLVCTRRAQRHSVEALFAAAYLHYPRYLNPITHKIGTIFDVIDWLILQRAMAKQYAGPLMGVGFRHWKAANLARMLSPSQRARFVSAADKLKPVDGAAVGAFVHWGHDVPEALHRLAAQCGKNVLRMEDGFVRSVGLGSDLIPPQSFILDEMGIYFDPRTPSKLEHILSTMVFSDADLARARYVRGLMVEHGISKYNLELKGAVCWPSQGRMVVLVVGQVEDDASIRCGGVNIITNLGLLAAARQACPTAYIVYKPHPDVVYGRRKGKLSLREAKKWADHVELSGSVIACIEACDAVHTITSLTGFDALLRGKQVVVYGQPFYAGWGLTVDVEATAPGLLRRTRHLHLDELVAGALLHYPLYWDKILQGYTTCEAVLNHIVAERAALAAAGRLSRLKVGYMRRQWRKIAILLAGWGVRTG